MCTAINLLLQLHQNVLVYFVIAIKQNYSQGNKQNHKRSPETQKCVFFDLERIYPDVCFCNFSQARGLGLL